MKNLSKNLLIFILGLLLVGGVAYAYMGNTPKVVVEGDYIEATETSNDKDESLGGFYSPDITGEIERTMNVNQTGATSAVYLNASDSGKTVLLSATGTTIVLPSVGNKGANFRFQVAGAMANSNMIVDSAEGDNIEGTLIVAGAVVDCASVDQINFVVDGENVGDYFEIYSDGTQWLLGDSGALTASKLTCTDPS